MAQRGEIPEFIVEAERATSAEDFQTAERALRRALRLQESQLGLVHPEVARTLNALGVVCNLLGRPDEAEFLYRRAVGIARRELVDDHPYIAESLRNLSELYEAQGKPEKLARLSAGVSSRFGLPEIDSTGHAEAAGGATRSVIVEPEATPVKAGGPDSGESPWPFPWRVWPVALLAGAGVVLFSIVWLFFSGSGGSDALGDDSDRAEVPAQVSIEDQNTGVTSSADSVDSAASAGGSLSARSHPGSGMVARPYASRTGNACVEPGWHHVGRCRRGGL